MKLSIKLVAAAALLMVAATQPVHASALDETATPAPQVTAITITNHYDGSDFVNVAAEAGSVVKIYDAETGGTLLAEGTVYWRSAILELPQGLGNLSTVYVTVTQPGMTESARVARAVTAIPQGPLAEDVGAIHYLDDVVAVTVSHVPAGGFAQIDHPSDHSIQLATVRNNSSAEGAVTIYVPAQKIDGLTHLDVQYFVLEETGAASSPYASLAIPAGTNSLSPITLNINDKITAGDPVETHNALQVAGIEFAYHEYADAYQTELANVRTASGALLNHGQIQSIVYAVNSAMELNRMIREGNEFDLWYAMGNAGLLDVNWEYALQYQDALRAEQQETGRDLSLTEMQSVIFAVNQAELSNGYQPEGDPGDPIGT